MNTKRTDRIPQYNKLISTSSGAEHTLSIFLTAKRREDMLMSASDPNAKVIVARERPIMVRYWKCHPYASLLFVRELGERLATDGKEGGTRTLDLGSLLD